MGNDRKLIIFYLMLVFNLSGCRASLIGSDQLATNSDLDNIQIEKTPTPESTPTTAPTPTLLPTPTPILPLGEGVIPVSEVKFNYSFDDDAIEDGIQLEGHYTIDKEKGYLIFENPIAYQFSESFSKLSTSKEITVGNGYILLFRTDQGTSFTIGIIPKNQTQESKGFWFENGALWQLIEGYYQTFGKSLEDVPMYHLPWYYLYLRVLPDGYLEARFWEKGNTENIEKFERDMGKDFINQELYLFLSSSEGKLFLDSFQEIKLESDELLP